MWLYGSPLRFYWHPTKNFWDIPILDHLAKRRSDRMWENATPAPVIQLRCEDCDSTNIRRDIEPEPSDDARSLHEPEHPSSPESST